MKICHIITRLIVGGAQENTIYTVKGLVEKGHKVTLVIGPTGGPEGSLIPEIEREKNIKLVVIKELVREISPVLDIICLVKLIRFFKKERYDVVHTHSAKAGILGRIAAKLARRETVVIHTIHGPSFYDYQPFFKNFLYITAEKVASLFTDRFICVGEIMKERYLEAGIGKESQYTVIYSGFDIRPYLEAEKTRYEKRRQLGIKDSEKVIGMVGRLFYLKGQEYLIHTFAEIVKEYPDVKLLLVGDGILRKQLENYASEKGVLPKVIFTGLVPPEEIPEYIAVMDILAHTSLREGLPKAVAQGFAGGKPVVAFDVDGAKELVVNNKTGYLIPPKDVAMLREKLLYLLKNQEISYKMGEEGRRIVKELFPVEKMVDKIEQVYIKVASSK
ncbi:MAG: glycosyltransferase family 4 protein [Candidatus Ratteibacteria bacterium]|nr:glycosyltransferase family 4 protein [Candidatus Ratteibacteria bacterium]